MQNEKNKNNIEISVLTTATQNGSDRTLEFSPATNLLEQSSYKYQLQERDNPQLYRHLFDYDNVPKVAFNHRFVPLGMPDEIWMTDTTFRDGQQSTSPFTVEQIVHLFKLLSKLGGPNGLIRQSEFFVYTEKDRRAVEECMSLGLKFPEVTSWIRASEKDFQLVKEIGIKETGILVSCSDYHIYNKMGLTRSQAMDKYLGVVKSALEYGIRPRCHFEDITRAEVRALVGVLAALQLDERARTQQIRRHAARAEVPGNINAAKRQRRSHQRGAVALHLLRQLRQVEAECLDRVIQRVSVPLVVADQRACAGVLDKPRNLRRCRRIHRAEHPPALGMLVPLLLRDFLPGLVARRAAVCLPVFVDPCRAYVYCHDYPSLSSAFCVSSRHRSGTSPMVMRSARIHRT